MHDHGSNDYATVQTGPRAPDPTSTPDLETRYPDAHGAARAVLERAGWTQGFDGDRAERFVSLVLGAALLELERPWRTAVDEARADRDAGQAELARVRARLGRTEEELASEERSVAIFLDKLRDVTDRAETAEREREAARDLAVRLEGELALLHTLAASTDRDWLERWATTDDDDGANAYATQMAAAARLVLAEIEEGGR